MQEVPSTRKEHTRSATQWSSDEVDGGPCAEVQRSTLRVNTTAQKTAVENFPSSTPRKMDDTVSVDEEKEMNFAIPTKELANP